MEEETRARVISGMWQYIKSNRLQDAEDRRFINLNSTLIKLFSSSNSFYGNNSQ
jgi:chromatin remodeling complex protein RSC6